MPEAGQLKIVFRRQPSSVSSSIASDLDLVHSPMHLSHPRPQLARADYFARFRHCLLASARNAVSERSCAVCSTGDGRVELERVGGCRPPFARRVVEHGQLPLDARTTCRHDARLAVDGARQLDRTARRRGALGRGRAHLGWSDAAGGGGDMAAGDAGCRARIGGLAAGPSSTTGSRR